MTMAWGLMRGVPRLVGPFALGGGTYADALPPPTFGFRTLIRALYREDRCTLYIAGRLQ